MITKQEVIVVKLVHDHDRIMYNRKYVGMINTVTVPGVEYCGGISISINNPPLLSDLISPFYEPM